MKKNYPFQKLNETIRIRFLIITICLFCVTLNAQQTYTFTNCGASGRFGPTQTQVSNTYTNTNLQGSVVVTGSGVQTWTVPQTGLYRITGAGARGGNTAGNYNGGNGSTMQGDFNLTGGSVLNILVGQVGEYNSLGYNTGGGGGTFVWITGQSLPLLAVGGGGGAGAGYNGANAVITTSGTAGVGNSNGTPGTGGNGANPGGGGWLSVGQDYTGGTGCGIKCSGNISGVTTGGATPTTVIVYHGCAGTSDTGDGGFGGASGGNGACSSSYGAGGGGGYSGGVGQAGASGFAAGGGGGGSYNGGTNQVNTAGNNSADGRVIIEELCNITLSVTGVNANNALCSGQSITLTTNAASNYSWSTGATTQSIVVSPTSSGIYSVTGTSTAACNAAASVSITVNNAVPSLSIANTASSTTGICLGKSATITAAGALSYTWTGTSSPTPTNGVSFIPSSTSTYVVTGSNGCGTSSAATSVTISPLLVAASTTSSLICSGYTASLSAFSSVTGYTWQPGNQQTSTYIVSPLSSTIYTVTASDGTCVGTATVGITTNPVPTINISTTNTTICLGSAVSLQATGGSGTNYTWTSIPATSTITGQSSISPSFPVAGAYAFYATGDNSFGCQTTNMQVIIVNTAPALTVSATKSLVCSAGASTVMVSGADAYQWDANANNATSQTTVVNPSVTTIYNVTGTLNSTQCTASSVVTVYVYSPTVSVTNPTSACLGIAVTLTGSVNNPASGSSNSYTWNGPGLSGGPGANVNVTPTSLTVYTLSAKSTTPANATNLVCIQSKTTSVGIAPNPLISVAPSRTFVCKGESVDLIASGANTYTWNNGAFSGATITVNPNSIATFSYLVKGTDANGCMNDTIYYLKINGCQGIEELANNSGISVYPNPNNGEFYIVADRDLKLQLINELGQIIKNFELNAANQHKIQTADIAKGFYFIVDEKKAIQPQKIIVK